MLRRISTKEHKAVENQTHDMDVHIEDDPHINRAFLKIAKDVGVDEDQIFKKTARLSVYNMIRYTPVHIRKNRLEGCRTFFYTSEYFKRKGKRGIRVYAYKTGCARETYLTQIGFSDYTKNLNSSVWVHCDCKHFKFRCEWVLDQLGASSLIYSQNRPPRITNPNQVPGVCKHVLNILDDAMKRTRQYARLDKNRDLEVDQPEIDVEPDKTQEYNPEKGPEVTTVRTKPQPRLKPVPQKQPSVQPFKTVDEPSTPQPSKPFETK